MNTRNDIRGVYIKLRYFCHYKYIRTVKQLRTIAAIILLLTIGCKPYKMMLTAENENSLVGKVGRGLLSKEYPWFKTGYESYNSALNTDIIYLKGYNKRVTFVVFGGAWCDDTRVLLPKFYRVLDEAQYPASAVKLYLVDRQKKTLKGEADKSGITNVPTFIIYRDGKEVGRIVETVKKSIEKDIKDILVNSGN